MAEMTHRSSVVQRHGSRGVFEAFFGPGWSQAHALHVPEIARKRIVEFADPLVEFGETFEVLVSHPNPAVAQIGERRWTRAGVV